MKDLAPFVEVELGRLGSGTLSPDNRPEAFLRHLEHIPLNNALAEEVRAIKSGVEAATAGRQAGAVRESRPAERLFPDIRDRREAVLLAVLLKDMQRGTVAACGQGPAV